MTYACHVPQKGPRQGWEDKCRPRTGSQCALAGGQTDNAASDHNFELKHQLILVYHGSYGLRSRSWTVNSGWSHPAEGNAKYEASKHSENSHISHCKFSNRFSSWQVIRNIQWFVLLDWTTINRQIQVNSRRGMLLSSLWCLPGPWVAATVPVKKKLESQIALHSHYRQQSLQSPH